MGLCCASCKFQGYPATKGAIRDGNRPISREGPTLRAKPIRLILEDANNNVTTVEVGVGEVVKDAIRRYRGSASGSGRGRLHFSYGGEAIDERDSIETVN